MATSSITDAFVCDARDWYAALDAAEEEARTREPEAPKVRVVNVPKDQVIEMFGKK